MVPIHNQFANWCGEEKEHNALLPLMPYLWDQSRPGSTVVYLMWLCSGGHSWVASTHTPKYVLYYQKYCWKQWPVTNGVDLLLIKHGLCSCWVSTVPDKPNKSHNTAYGTQDVWYLHRNVSCFKLSCTPAETDHVFNSWGHWDHQV